MPGERVELSDRGRHPTGVPHHERPRAFAQRQGPSVVAQSRPRREQLVRAGVGQVPGRWPAVHEPPPRQGADALDPSLLRHHLGDEHLPRILGIANSAAAGDSYRASGTGGC